MEKLEESEQRVIRGPTLNARIPEQWTTKLTD
jgi:hypothetical protein